MLLAVSFCAHHSGQGLDNGDIHLAQDARAWCLLWSCVVAADAIVAPSLPCRLLPAILGRHRPTRCRILNSRRGGLGLDP